MQTAELEDDWRPGFAKRAPNFDQVCESARQWRWTEDWPVSRIVEAVLLGASDLTTTQKVVLMIYARRLNHKQLAKGIACVWPSTALVSMETNLSANTLRIHRKALEAKGYMVRDYNRANRPADVEAFDLGPLMARLDALDGEIEAKDANYKALKAQQAEHVVSERHICAQEQNSGRLEQSHIKNRNTVQKADAPMARNYPSRWAATHPNELHNAAPNRAPPVDNPHNVNGFPRKARDFRHGQAESSVTTRNALAELQAAVDLCPRLLPLVPPLLLETGLPGPDFQPQELAVAAAALLPGSDRNNDDTFRWAWSRHGVRALAMLAIALEDPSVKEPARYFGWMACREANNAPDLRFNLVRLLKGRGAIPSPALQRPRPTAADVARAAPQEIEFAGPGADDPVFQRLIEALRPRIGVGALGSWFSRCGFHGIADGVLQLSTPGPTARDAILQKYLPAVRDAARALELGVVRVVIELRKSPANVLPTSKT